MRAVHPHAQHAAEVAEAAAAQGRFWDMHDRLFTGQDALDDNSLLRHASELSLDWERVREELAPLPDVLEGHVLYDNQPMLDLLRTSGHPVQVRCDGGDVLSVELDVGQPAAIAGTR